jgi:hypothetical protein
MTRLLYALPSTIGSSENLLLPGVRRYAELFKMYGNWVIPADRTGTIRMPVDLVAQFPLAKYRPFRTEFEELCNTRAIQVLSQAEKLGTSLYVLYSGGIDSTCLLVSLLKNASPEQKKHIVVLLSQDSISENRRFYDEHIRGKLRMGSSITFPDLIGEDVCLLSAEHADMVLGTEKIGKLMMRFGPDSIYKRYDRTMLAELYADYLGGDIAAADLHMGIFERLRDVSPVPIVSNMDFLWWVNFCIKWQSCFYYILLFASPRNAAKVTPAYVDTRFISFYNTDEFQLWSMNNLDKRIKDTWKSYKWVAKDIIYEFNKDEEYRDNKTKKGSLLPLIGFNPPFHFIDEQLRFRNDLSPEEYLIGKNDYA